MNSLLDDFKSYEEIYEKYNQDQSINLNDYSNINPTTLLPLILHCDSDSNFDNNLKNEIKNFLKEYSNKKTIYFQKITPEYNFIYSTLENLFSNFIGNINEKNTFFYFFAEMLSNIDDHSNFDNAYVLAKKLDENIIDLCFLDDGVSIPSTLNQLKEDNLTIYDTTKGLSSKKEEGRGFGLPSTIKIMSTFEKGEILIASRNAIYFKTNDNELSDNLNSNLIEGTLVSLRFNSTMLPNIYSII